MKPEPLMTPEEFQTLFAKLATDALSEAFSNAFSKLLVEMEAREREIRNTFLDEVPLEVGQVWRDGLYGNKDRVIIEITEEMSTGLVTLKYGVWKGDDHFSTYETEEKYFRSTLKNTLSTLLPNKAN